jgi:L-fucose isomerase-like protein
MGKTQEMKNEKNVNTWTHVNAIQYIVIPLQTHQQDARLVAGCVVVSVLAPVNFTNVRLIECQLQPTNRSYIHIVGCLIVIVVILRRISSIRF